MMDSKSRGALRLYGLRPIDVERLHFSIGFSNVDFRLIDRDFWGWGSLTPFK